MPAPPTPPRWKTRGGDPGPGRRWQAALIVVLFFVAVAAAAFAGWWYARESPPHQGPIVLISAENLAANRLTPYGGSAPDTPAIDALAIDGVVFDRAYAHSPQTLPSHASILSGQLPFEHGVRDDAGFAMKEDARTLAELLGNRGFNTGAAVSTFLLRPESGVAQGFSFFDADLPEQPDGDGPATARDSAHTIDVAERWMRTQDDQRYLLFVQVDEAAADEAVSRVVQELKDRDLYDEATIFLVGDHGDEQAVPSLADTSLHVPLIVKQPDSEGAGRRVVAPVQHIDLLPTILDLVRAPIPSGIRGRSLRPVLDDEDATVPEQPIYAESLAARFRLGGHAVYGLTSGARRLIRGEHDELFDLETGGQSLALDTEDATRLRATLDRLVLGRRIPDRAPIRTADEAAFASLGYLPDLALVSAAPVAIESDVQATLLELHRSAALLVGQAQLRQGDRAPAVDRARAPGAGRGALSDRLAAPAHGTLPGGGSGIRRGGAAAAGQRRCSDGARHDLAARARLRTGEAPCRRRGGDRRCVSAGRARDAPTRSRHAWRSSGSMRRRPRATRRLRSRRTPRSRSRSSCAGDCSTRKRATRTRSRRSRRR